MSTFLPRAFAVRGGRCAEADLPCAELLEALLVVWVVGIGVACHSPAGGGKGRGGRLELRDLEGAHRAHTAGLGVVQTCSRDASQNGGGHVFGGLERRVDGGVS